MALMTKSTELCESHLIKTSHEIEWIKLAAIQIIVPIIIKRLHRIEPWGEKKSTRDLSIVVPIRYLLTNERRKNDLLNDFVIGCSECTPYTPMKDRTTQCSRPHAEYSPNMLRATGGGTSRHISFNIHYA